MCVCLFCSEQYDERTTLSLRFINYSQTCDSHRDVAVELFILCMRRLCDAITPALWRLHIAFAAAVSVDLSFHLCARIYKLRALFSEKLRRVTPVRLHD